MNYDQLLELVGARAMAFAVDATDEVPDRSQGWLGRSAEARRAARQKRSAASERDALAARGRLFEAARRHRGHVHLWTYAHLALIPDTSADEFVLLSKEDVIGHIPFPTLIQADPEDLMGILDDIRKLATKQADFRSLSGMYEPGDRVALKPDLATAYEARKGPQAPRFRTGTVVSVDQADDDGWDAKIACDDGEERTFDCLALEGIERHIERKRTVAQLPGVWICQSCWDTGYTNAQPSQGRCSCATRVNYDMDDATFVSKRRSKKRTP